MLIDLNPIRLNGDIVDAGVPRSLQKVQTQSIHLAATLHPLLVETKHIIGCKTEMQNKK